MKYKIAFSLIIVLTLFLTISSISAIDNSTESISLSDDSSQTVEINKTETKINASDVETFTDLESTFTVKLTSNGTSLPNKQVKILLNGVDYNQITDGEGKASINFKLKSGIYTAFFSFAGDDNYAESSGSALITVKSNLVTYVNVEDVDVNYREGLKSIFEIKLVDINSNTLNGKVITIKVDGKIYSSKTNSKGIATFYLNLKKGSHVVEYSFAGDKNYISSSGTFTINVKSKLSKGHGYWVNKWDMKKVNLKKLSKLGTKHIFLAHTAVDLYGKAKVIKWINKAHKYGIKVHLWIAAFYKNGKFVHPANKKGVYNYKYMDGIVDKALKYASIKNLDGIHFDYLRYGGNAYKYKNSVSAINYFVKKASVSIHNLKPEMIVSAAVMPEPNSMKYHYGQDVLTMSKYMDVIIPMLYKGNYHAKSSWIKKTTKKFTKLTNGAKIWAGIQSYKSDAHVKKLSYKSLFKDVKNAKKGGAEGIVIFRWGITKFINFKKL